MHRDHRAPDGSRRQFIFAATAAACLGFPRAWAQSYPARPVTLVVPYTAGGATDVTARRFAEGLAAALGSSVVVENRPGAATNLAAAYVARAPQDGYTLYFAPGTMTSVNPYIYKNLPYKPDDFAPISLVSKQAFVLSVRPDFPATTVAQFVEYARSRPAGITMGHVGTGSVTHIVTEWLAERLGIKVQGIPYKGTANSTVDLMGGRLDAQLEGISTGVPMHVSGKYRLIASMGEERANLPAGVQTFREAGYPDLVGYALFGLMAPAGTPAAVIERLGEATRRAVSAPEFVRRLGASGEIAAPSASPAEYAGLLKVESERWGRIIKPMRIQLD